jgi:hypothetical protein
LLVSSSSSLLFVICLHVDVSTTVKRSDGQVLVVANCINIYKDNKEDTDDPILLLLEIVDKDSRGRKIIREFGVKFPPKRRHPPSAEIIFQQRSWTGSLSVFFRSEYGVIKLLLT